MSQLVLTSMSPHTVRRGCVAIHMRNGVGYTGYAGSEGKPSEQDVYSDIDALWEYLTMIRRIHPNQIIFYSRSVGSGPTLYLSEKLCKARTPPAGVILQSPILSVFRIAFDFRITLPGDIFPNVDRIPSIECPVFIMHGTHDEVVPFWHGQELFIATQIRWRYKPFWIAGAGHNNIEILLRDSGLLFKRLHEFLEFCGSPMASDPSVDSHYNTLTIDRGANTSMQIHASPVEGSSRDGQSQASGNCVGILV